MTVTSTTIKPASQGFSLVELSVVILIIGILVYMTLAAGVQQLQIARIKQTQYKLQKIQTALTVYLKTYGHLPCPADGSLLITTAGFGTQSGYNNPTPAAPGDATCNSASLLTDPLPAHLYIGVVPVTDLGMSADSLLDGWGRRITYIVSENCVDPDNWSSSNTYKCGSSTPGSGTINSAANGGYVTIYGKNGQKWQDAAARKERTESAELHASHVPTAIPGLNKWQRGHTNEQSQGISIAMQFESCSFI